MFVQDVLMLVLVLVLDVLEVVIANVQDHVHLNVILIVLHHVLVIV